MALVVEDGTIVAGANSYVDVASARSYACARGMSLSDDDLTLEAQLIVAMDYLESLRDKYQGTKTEPGIQELQWPRQDVVIDCEELDPNTIPVELQKAQCQLAVEQEAGAILFPTESGKFVTREKVGPLETEFSDKVIPSTQPNMTSVDALLEPLLKYQYRSSALRTVRI